MHPFLIYGLCEPGTYIPRYVGYTNDLGRRLREHRKTCGSRSTHKECWLFSLRAKGQAPAVVLLGSTTTREQAASLEVLWIKAGRGAGWRLVNGTDGGDGLAPSAETRAKAAATRAAPGYVAGCAARAEAHWADPEYRARHEEAMRRARVDPVLQEEAAARRLATSWRNTLKACNRFEARQAKAKARAARKEAKRLAREARRASAPARYAAAEAACKARHRETLAARKKDWQDAGRKPPEGVCTLSSFALRKGLIQSAVSHGILTGRLVASVGWTTNGVPCIIDYALAAKEWDATSKPQCSPSPVARARARATRT